MKTTAYCAIGAIVLSTSLADAALVGLHVEQHAIDMNGYTPGAGTTTWRLYAEFDDPNDQLTSVGGSPGAGGVIIGDPNLGFYQNIFGGSFSTQINPVLYGVFPSLAYDSWVTIGASDNDGSNNLVNSGFDTTSFDAGGNLYVPNGSWDLAMNDPNAFGDVLPGMSNYQVLVGQFTVWGYGASTAPWGYLNLSGFSSGFTPGEPIPWSVDGVTFGVPAPGALALLGLAGIAGRRRRRRS